MKGKRAIGLLLVLTFMVGMLAACNQGGSSASGSREKLKPVDERDHYTASYYVNYSWYDLKPWGVDTISAHWQDKFKITLNISKPDANEEEMLNLRITANDLPDAIWMERNAQNIRMARLGILVPLDDLKPLVNNNWYDDQILASTQKQYEIDGKNYCIPNWARKSASGGNNAWMYTTDIYKAAGSPVIRTFEDLYAYATVVKQNVPKTSTGLDVIPVLTKDSGTFGTELVRAIYRSFGGPYLGNSNFYGRVDGKYQTLFRDPVWRDAVLEANKWFREGLVAVTNFTDNDDQFYEKLTNGRGGLIWEDHSSDDGRGWRRILRSNEPGNSIEIFSINEGGKNYLYPPAKGLAYEKIYGEHYGTLGWNGTFITTAAKEPARIFELFSYLLTKEGSIEMMYGPPGFFWKELDANGNPIMINIPDDYPEEAAQYATWFWTLAGHADNVDLTKFAVNNALPEDKRKWVEYQQANLFTPLMMPLTDEYENIGNSIEPDTDLHIVRTTINDAMQAELPKIIMAASADEAARMFDDMLVWLIANGVADVEAAYDAKYQSNLSMQGGTIYNR